VRSVRAENAPPGAPKRQRKPGATAPTPTLSLDAAADVQIAGYGSPVAMEATCDAHTVWSSAKPTMRLMIGGLIEGKTQVDIASELKIDRFTVARMIKTLQHQFENAA
jgi:hypothetical protein